MSEPPGLCIGKVVLADGTVVLGVLGEPFLCEGNAIDSADVNCCSGYQHGRRAAPFV